MKFKICCIRSLEEADMAIAAGAWAIGLVAAMVKPFALDVCSSLRAENFALDANASLLHAF